jgi:pimeloyl-ACP methyl ester carboxylesterase
MSVHPFEIRFNDTSLYGDTYRNRCQTLVLHGAGRSSRSRFSNLREKLNRRGIPSAAFDFIGHGETGGQITDSSLKQRTLQADAVIRQVSKEPLTLIGASMSAYTAIQLTGIFTVKNLILLVPAVYTPDAYPVNFGPGFSQIIRQPNSWQNSDAFEILNKFSGNLLVIAAQNDRVIPKGVIDSLHSAGSHLKMNTLYTVPSADHLSVFADPEEYEKILDRVTQFCTS